MVERLRISVSRIFVALVAILVLVSASRWETRLPNVASILFFSGLLAAAVATVGRLRCTLYIAGYKTRSLIRVGPYSVCHNPLYFFSFIGAVGIGPATETMTVAFIVATAFTLYYPLVIRSEEARLRKRHPEAFEDYRRRVPAFLPRWSLLAEPGEYTVKPKLFRRHVFDALWFVWMAGILEVVEELHELGFLPTFLLLY